MGITAENVAAKWNISREDQDQLALESHQRAEQAWAENRFKDQIVPVTIKTRKGDVVFDKDEHFRAGAKIEDFQKMKPVFIKENGTVTAANASGINDAASAVLLMEAGAAKARGVKPLARLVSYAHAGVEPEHMGIGPVPACRLALEKAGLKMADMDVIEANEAFAAQALAVARDLQFDPAKLNPNGSGIGLGHPIGATGNILTVKAVHELHRSGGKYALVTMCIGAGAPVKTKPRWRQRSHATTARTGRMVYLKKIAPILEQGWGDFVVRRAGALFSACSNTASPQRHQAPPASPCTCAAASRTVCASAAMPRSISSAVAVTKLRRRVRTSGVPL
jgi:hypothetical protein